MLTKLAQTVLRMFHKAIALVNTGGLYALRTADTEGTQAIAGFYLLIFGIVDQTVHWWALQTADALLPEWVSGIGPKTAVYNRALFTYMILVLGVVAAYALHEMSQYMPTVKRKSLVLVKRLVHLWFLCAVVCAVGASSLLIRICFITSGLLFIPCVLRSVRSDAVDTLGKYSLGRGKAAVGFLLFILLAVSLGVGAKAWYPVRLPNDYYELGDEVLIGTGFSHTSKDSARRSDVIDCLEQEADWTAALQKGGAVNGGLGKALDPVTGATIPSGAWSQESLPTLGAMSPPGWPTCALDVSPSELNKLREPILKTGTWQSQAGRLLYHHAFVVVPALHLLRYGIASPIPYVYGIGNTLFHAALLRATSETLTGYFHTYPFAQLTGIIVIALLVLYMTGSSLAVAAAVAVCLTTLFEIGFEYIFLAPGFSPLRYAGLVAQTASVFFLFRRSPQSGLPVLLAALVFSCLWNAEFACIGFVGQVLALLSSQLLVSLRKRLIWFGLIVIALIASMLLVTITERGFLHTITLGLYGISPSLTPLRFIVFCVCIAPAIVFLAFATRQFQTKECAARRSILSVLALVMIKFLWFSWVVHLYNCLTFVAPLTLGYLKWPAASRSAAGEPVNGGYVIITVGLVLMCLSKSVSYYRGAEHFHLVMTRPFAQNSWTDLGESIIEFRII